MDPPTYPNIINGRSLIFWIGKILNTNNQDNIVIFLDQMAFCETIWLKPFVVHWFMENSAF